MMEMKMTTDLETALPAVIGFNFDELKNELTERLHYYNNLVVTEEAIKEAKEDMAKLRKLKEALDTHRKEVKKKFLAPYNAFEVQVKELTALIDAPVAAINGQVKTFEEQEKAKKYAEIEAAYNELVPEAFTGTIPLNRVLDPRWLNKGTTMKSIREEIAKIAQRAKVDMVMLDMVAPEYQAAVRAKFIETLDVSAALDYRDKLMEAELAFQQHEAERVNNRTHVNETPPVAVQEPAKEDVPQHDKEEKLYLLRLEFQLTMQQANVLKQFLANNNINYTKI